MVKNLPTNAGGMGDTGLGQEDSPGAGNGNAQASTPGPYVLLIISENHERICKIAPMSPLSCPVAHHWLQRPLPVQLPSDKKLKKKGKDSSALALLLPPRAPYHAPQEEVAFLS